MFGMYECKLGHYSAETQSLFLFFRCRQCRGQVGRIYNRIGFGINLIYIGIHLIILVCM